MQFTIGFIVGMIVFFFAYIGSRYKKSQFMHVHFPDGSWFYGERKWNYPPTETHGTHHFMIIDGSEEFVDLIGKKVAVPINSARFFILDKER